MGSIYKETSSRKKNSFILTIAIIFIVALLLQQIIDEQTIKGIKISNFLNIVCIVLITVVIFLEMLKYRITYTYLIIGNQFIIHKVKGNRDRVVENVKLKNIEFIGKGLFTNIRYDKIICRKYTCSIFNFNNYYCVYKEGNRYVKFYFQPSRDLIEKLKILIKKRLIS